MNAHGQEGSNGLAAVKGQLDLLNSQAAQTSIQIQETLAAWVADQDNRVLENAYKDAVKREKRLGRRIAALESQLAAVAQAVVPPQLVPAQAGAGGAGNSHEDNTATFLRKILPLGCSFPLLELPSLFEAKLLDGGRRVRLPVLPFLYDKLRGLTSAWDNWIEPLAAGVGPWRLALSVSNILDKRISQVGSELEMPGFIDMLVYDILQLVATQLGGVSMKRYRDQTEQSRTNTSLRPDFWLTAANAMLFKGEDKTKATDLPAARADLLRKMCDWNVAYHGQVPYLPCYAAAGLEIQFFAIPRGNTQLVNLVATPRSVDNLLHRVEIIHMALLMYCVIDHLTTLLPENHQLLGLPQQRQYGTSITFWGRSVLKEVQLQDNAMLAVIQERMGDVYAVQSPHLIKAQQGYPITRGGKYSVYLEPMGTGLDISTLYLYDLRPAVKGILLGLEALHKARLGHGDLRWENVIFLCADRFMLIDLESTVSLDDLDEQQRILACGVRPRAWGPNLEAWVTTTGPSGQSGKCFTEASDLYMLGLMLQEALRLHPGINTGVSAEVAQGLLQKRYPTVQEVLATL